MTPFLRKRDVASNVSTITRLAIDLNYLCLTCTARQILGLLRRAQDFGSGLGRPLNASTSDLKVLRMTPFLRKRDVASNVSTTLLLGIGPG